jgi:hypothetical protein
VPLAEKNAAARHHALRILISLHNKHHVHSVMGTLNFSLFVLVHYLALKCAKFIAASVKIGSQAWRSCSLHFVWFWYKRELLAENLWTQFTCFVDLKDQNPEYAFRNDQKWMLSNITGWSSVILLINFPNMHRFSPASANKSRLLSFWLPIHWPMLCPPEKSSFIL